MAKIVPSTEHFQHFLAELPSHGFEFHGHFLAAAAHLLPLSSKTVANDWLSEVVPEKRRTRSGISGSTRQTCRLTSRVDNKALPPSFSTS